MPEVNIVNVLMAALGAFGLVGCFLVLYVVGRNLGSGSVYFKLTHYRNLISEAQKNRRQGRPWWKL